MLGLHKVRLVAESHALGCAPITETVIRRNVHQAMVGNTVGVIGPEFRLTTAI